MKFLGAGKAGFQPGHLRSRTNVLLRQSRGRVSTKGLHKKDKGARFAVSSRGFMQQEREHKVIKYRSPGYGLGRGHGSHIRTHGDSVKAREDMSIAHLNKAHPHKGHPQNSATRSKISVSLKKYNATHPGFAKARLAKARATRLARKAGKKA